AYLRDALRSDRWLAGAAAAVTAVPVLLAAVAVVPWRTGQAALAVASLSVLLGAAAGTGLRRLLAWRRSEGPVLTKDALRPLEPDGHDMVDTRAPVALPEHVRRLFDESPWVTVGTVDQVSGSPHLVVLRVRREGDDLVILVEPEPSARRNLEQDPRASLLASDPTDPRRFIEVVASVSVAESGGPDSGHTLAVAVPKRIESPVE
ncbi:MAG: pyridoxamine 5'-phosphate oxidase family protein, partial [Carbonactinosporaceae bacterium]